MADAHAFCVKEDGKLVLTTLFPTERAAMAYWIVVHNHTHVRDHWTDAAVLRLFKQFTINQDIQLVRVNITEVCRAY